MESSRLVRAVFVVLVVATVAAFYVTQALKQEVPVVLRFAVETPAFSPNGDHVRDTSRIGFDLSEPADITFAVIGPDGNEVRRLANDRRLSGDAHHRFAWNGRDDDGNIVPDGAYRMRVTRSREGRSIDSFKTVDVDTRAPRVRIASAKPGVVDPRDGRPRIRVDYTGPSNASPEFRVYRSDGGPVRIVRRFRGNTRTGFWDGTVISGALAADGDYAFQVRVRDAAGNQTVAPRRIPSARNTRAGAGVAIRRLTLQGPLNAVSAGAVARLKVGPSPRRFRFALSRLGDVKPIRSGTRRGGLLRVGIPEQAHTGVYLLRLRSRGRRAVWPIAVAGLPATRAARSRPRPLVVLPALTWQGTNEYDSDLDGFVDTLDHRPKVPLDRPLRDGRLPQGFGGQVAPLLEFLDREHLAYDLTTDVALTRGAGPSVANAPGVVFAATTTWLPRSLRDSLRVAVHDDGLKVVSFGERSLQRQVGLNGDELRDPSPPRPDDLFGERTRVFGSDPAAPLAVQRDELGLFRGGDSFVGQFSRFERSLRRPEGSRLLSGAGRESDQPAFVAYRLGKGIVIRPGTAQWAAGLREDQLGVEVPNVTRRIWSLLSKPR